MVSSRDQTPWTMPASEALLRRDERLLALDQLAARLAHDFNNLQAPALGYITLLQEDCADAEPVSGYLRAMERAGRHAEGVLERLLKAVRPQRSFRRTQTDFAALLNAEVEQWRAELPLDSGIRVEAEVAPCAVNLDPRHWQGAIRELLANARAAMSSGGALSVKLSPHALESSEAAGLGIAGGPVYRLAIEDTGAGMDAATLENAFDPLFTTRGKQKAMGLGLTFVHAIVRLQGGQVTLRSEPGKGTSVTIWLPDAEPVAGETKPARPQQPAEVVSSPAGSTAGGRLCLVVDDDALVLATVATAMHRTGWRVLKADSGAEALELFARHRGGIAMVISDVTMPEMNGFELVARLRQQESGLPVLFVSGDVLAVPQEYLETLPGTAPPLLKKPFPVPDLIAAIREIRT